jgi:hypothetical protein
VEFAPLKNRENPVAQFESRATGISEPDGSESKNSRSLEERSASTRKIARLTFFRGSFARMISNSTGFTPRAAMAFDNPGPVFYRARRVQKFASGGKVRLHSAKEL